MYLRSFSCYLIPWPGPQEICSIHMFLEPGPIEIQSSPVFIKEEVMVTLVEVWMWMPSVFGLQLGADILTPWILTFAHQETKMWNILLFNEVKPLTKT